MHKLWVLITLSNFSNKSALRGSHPSTASPATALSHGGQPAAICSASVYLPNLKLKTAFFSELPFFVDLDFFGSRFRLLTESSSFSFSGSSLIFSSSPNPPRLRNKESRWAEAGPLWRTVTVVVVESKSGCGRGGDLTCFELMQPI